MILPTLKQLHYLTALHEHRHFGRAAEACFVTQSTLSAGLRDLELLLDAALVERTRRVVRMTPLGERIARKAYDILQDATQITQMARAAGRPLAGELRLGVIPTIAPYWLPSLIPLIRAAYPDLKLYLREDMSPLVCDSLARGGLDCALLALPFACGDVESEVLFLDPLRVILPANDPLTTQDSIAPADIDPTRLLLLEDGHCLKDHAISACERPDLHPNRTAILGTSLHTLAPMVDNGLGITIVPQMAIDAGLLTGLKVAVRPLEAAHASRTIALVWRRRSPRETEFRMLATFLRRQNPLVFPAEGG